MLFLTEVLALTEFTSGIHHLQICRLLLQCVKADKLQTLLLPLHQSIQLWEV
jgi:hypothetical protein